MAGEDISENSKLGNAGCKLSETLTQTTQKSIINLLIASFHHDYYHR